MTRERREPRRADARTSTREKTSRPISSVPSRSCSDGACERPGRDDLARLPCGASSGAARTATRGDDRDRHERARARAAGGRRAPPPRRPARGAAAPQPRGVGRRAARRRRAPPARPAVMPPPTTSGTAASSSRVYACAGAREDLLGRARARRRRPRCMTATSSATARAAARSCVTNSSAMPSVAAQVAEQVEHLRGERDVERRHRLVAGQQRRRDGDRAGDRGALALAAGQLAAGSTPAASAGSPTAASVASIRAPALVGAGRRARPAARRSARRSSATASATRRRPGR